MLPWQSSRYKSRVKRKTSQGDPNQPNLALWTSEGAADFRSLKATPRTAAVEVEATQQQPLPVPGGIVLLGHGEIPELDGDVHRSLGLVIHCKNLAPLVRPELAIPILGSLSDTQQNC